MPEENLLPCPFCGGRAAVESVEGATTKSQGGAWSVGCTEDEDGHCYGYQSLTTFERRSDAIKAWNKRVPPQIQQWCVLGSARTAAGRREVTAAFFATRPEAEVVFARWRTENPTAQVFLLAVADGWREPPVIAADAVRRVQ